MEIVVARFIGGSTCAHVLAAFARAGWVAAMAAPARGRKNMH